MFAGAGAPNYLRGLTDACLRQRILFIAGSGEPGGRGYRSRGNRVTLGMLIPSSAAISASSHAGIGGFNFLRVSSPIPSPFNRGVPHTEPISYFPLRAQHHAELFEFLEVDRLELGAAAAPFLFPHNCLRL